MGRKIMMAYMRLISNLEVCCISDGYFFVEDNYFEGFLTDDYITGAYDRYEKRFNVELLTHDYESNDTYISLFHTDEIVNFEYYKEYFLKSSTDISLSIQLVVEDLPMWERYKEYLEYHLERVKKINELV